MWRRALRPKRARSSWACSELPPTIIATSFGLITLDITAAVKSLPGQTRWRCRLRKPTKCARKWLSKTHMQLARTMRETRIVAMTNYMIDVGRNDVAEALTPECGHNCARFGEFVVIDHQNVGHIIHRICSAEASSWTAQPRPPP